MPSCSPQALLADKTTAPAATHQVNWDTWMPLDQQKRAAHAQHHPKHNPPWSRQHSPWHSTGRTCCGTRPASESMYPPPGLNQANDPSCSAQQYGSVFRDARKERHTEAVLTNSAFSATTNQGRHESTRLPGARRKLRQMRHMQQNANTTDHYCCT